jgi:site-specific DNA-methyltransferase (adenine-specific)
MINDVFEKKEHNGKIYTKKLACELYNDHFENAKHYNIPRAQLIIADIPYNLGNNAYASNPSWYEGGDNKNGESNKAGKSFFKTDENFRINNFFDFCTRYLKDEPKDNTGRTETYAPAMIVFCAFEQMQMVIDEAYKHGLKKYYPLVFIKNYSAQVLKANMKIVGATEYAVVLYRNKLPKFRNNGKMIFNWFDWIRDTTSPKLHPTQKPVKLLETLIEIFTDEGDVVIDPCAGSGSTLIASRNLMRKSYGFEIEKEFYKKAINWIEGNDIEERKKENKQINIFDIMEE